MKQVLGDFFDDVCDRYSENECIYFKTSGTHYSYKRFQQYVHQIEKGLVALGLNKGDLIAIKSSNTPQWLALQWAGFKLGVIIIGLNEALTQSEVNYAMSHTGAKLLFTDDMSYMISDNRLYRVIIWDEANQFIIDLGKGIKDEEIEVRNLNVSAEDPALILFTSGTTSKPKAVLMKNSAIVRAIEAYIKRLNYSEEDTVLICTPLAHMMGCLYSIMPAMAFGARMIIIERFKTDLVLELIQQEKCTVLNAVPTMFLFLLENFQGYDISSLRTGLIAGSYASSNLLQQINEKLGMKELLQAYGQTETLAVTGTCLQDDLQKHQATTGRPFDNVEIKIVPIGSQEALPPYEKGEVLVRSPYCMVEYLNNEEITKMTRDEDGWIHTGDIGFLDEDGYLYIKARIKEIIIKGGENICPTEIEDALNNVEGIKEAIVIGVPDKYKTEEICAFIIAEKDEPVLVQQIQDKLKQKLARYKIPKYIIRVNHYPKTSSGKVRKEELKFLYNVIENTL